MQQQYFNSLIKVLTSIPFILAYCKDTLLADCSWLFVFESSAAPVVSESVSEDVVLVRSVDVTVRCHAGMLGGAAGVEPTMGEGNCFLQKKKSCLPVCPWIFEHLKNGIIAHFKRIFTLKRSPRIFWSLFSG